jgi:hypothetical protein
MQLPLPDEGLPPRVVDHDRSLYTDPLTGTRYVILEHALWFLWIDLAEYTKVRNLPARFPRSYLPLEFIPGQGCRLTMLEADVVAELFAYLQGRVEGVNLGRVVERWAANLDSIRAQHGLKPEGGQYLVQRHQTWFLRMMVPRALRDKLGKREIVETLGTRDIRVAQALRWARVDHWKTHFEALRADLVSDSAPHTRTTRSLEVSS